ncbi:4Fe-4S ferredoxin, iron-sulfur binding (plasmid) [Azospirillum sp. B510]|uniref:4Fe-4S dicluster domain-containing protein n=1 Tax=Azospirillum sp. (strain B510) TaxID=137722 RepID=UPI0001C4C84D|nr:4Fe-4S dicluster domain-containing protein [Azospirillum sp. B510]BAI75138.1 4Fe-4S ferredoxin, iron-sulfur binding [Azospirillum sp. B510]
MAMLKTILGNLLRPSRTRAPADMPDVPPAYRGALAHEAARCTACGTCAYVCAPKAISFTQDPGLSVSWRFFIGQCSFCGLCAQNCPTQAIRLEAGVPAGMNSAAGDGFRLESVIPLRACTRCGAAHVPLPASTMDALWGSDEAERGYCPECRRWAAGARLRVAFVPAAGEEVRHER